MKTIRFTTQRQIRKEFWHRFPEYKMRDNWRRLYGTPKQRTVLSTDTRCAFVDWIDSLQKDGEISEALASRVTLD